MHAYTWFIISSAQERQWSRESAPRLRVHWASHVFSAPAATVAGEDPVRHVNAESSSYVRVFGSDWFASVLGDVCIDYIAVYCTAVYGC